MTEEIIKSITASEAQASERKARAYERAAEIASEAEVRAAEIAKSSEEVCKAYRETQLKNAEAEAERQYCATHAKKRAEAEAYAARLMDGLELPVSKIVRRICDGDC